MSKEKKESTNKVLSRLDVSTESPESTPERISKQKAILEQIKETVKDKLFVDGAPILSPIASDEAVGGLSLDYSDGDETASSCTKQ